MIISIYPVGPDFYRKRTILIRNGIFVELTTWKHGHFNPICWGQSRSEFSLKFPTCTHIFQDKPADSWQNVHHSGWVPGFLFRSKRRQSQVATPSITTLVPDVLQSAGTLSVESLGVVKKSLSRFNHWLGNQLVHRWMDGWMDGWTHTQRYLSMSFCLSVCFCLFCFVLFWFGFWFCLFVCLFVFFLFCFVLFCLFVCWCVYIYMYTHAHIHTH